MSHVSLPRLGHLAVDNNYESPASLSPVETSGTDEDDTSGNSTPDQNVLETPGEAVVVSVATTPQKAGSAVVELTPIQGPLESTIKTDNDAVLVSVKRKHLAGKPHFQEFFGFYTLFWLSVGLFMTRTLIDNYRAGTSVLDFEIVRILRRDLFKVALTDLGMYLAGYFCVALQWAIRAKLIRWRSSGWIIQNAFQTFFLFFFMWLAKYCNFPWIGRVYLLLHSLVLLMKMHSYAFYNGYLWSTLEDLHIVEGSLKKLQDGKTKDTSSATVEELNELHKFLREELAAQSTTTPFPTNLTLFNYFEYSMFPTLVYQIDYPRTESINWSYVGEKVAAVFGVFFLMIVLAEKYLYPIAIEALKLRPLPFREKALEYPLILLNLTLPFTLMYILVFYIIWDAILNAIAELTRFSDREFYGPWWNSITWDQFARDWNVPVHRFLLRHVYHSSISTFNVSKKAATLITFLLSSCIHELVMYVIFERLRGYLLFLQMCQLPLVVLSRSRFMRNKVVLGNVIFWFGILTGPSLMCSMYLVF